LLRTSHSKLDTLQLEKLIHKVDDMELRHNAEMAELTQTHNMILYNKDRDYNMAIANANKETKRLKDLLKSKNEEMEKMKAYLDDIEEDLKKL